MNERQTRIIMFEGPQGSGKTTASLFLSKNGYKNTRGIPTGEELVSNRESDNWKQSLNLLTKELTSQNRSSMDRSIWSLVVYNMRKKPKNAELVYNIGKSLFLRRINNVDYCIAILDSKAEECIAREEKGGPIAIKGIEEMEKELSTYKILADRLEEDGLAVVRINNSEISEKEFLNIIEQSFGY